LTEAEIRDCLRDWIRERAQGRLNGELTDESPLLDLGLLSSLDVTELILYVEHLKGDEVDVEALEPGLLTNINTLYRGFFGD
jgi:acyl carrier protein